MDALTLKKQLKTASAAPVYLVLGTQSVMMAEAKKAFLNLVPKEERVMNVGSYDLEEESLSTALDDAMSAPFFGERRLVFLNKPAFLTTGGEKGKMKQNPELLKNYLTHPQLSTILVIMAPYEKLDGRKGVVKELKKGAVTVEVQPLNEQSARKNIQTQVSAAGFRFTPGALDELVKRTNADYSLSQYRRSTIRQMNQTDHHVDGIQRHIKSDTKPHPLAEEARRLQPRDTHMTCNVT